MKKAVVKMILRKRKVVRLRKKLIIQKLTRVCRDLNSKTLKEFSKMTQLNKKNCRSNRRRKIAKTERWLITTSLKFKSTLTNRRASQKSSACMTKNMVRKAVVEKRNQVKMKKKKDTNHRIRMLVNSSKTNQLINQKTNLKSQPSNRAKCCNKSTTRC